KAKEMQMIAGTPGFIAPEVLNHTCEDLYKADGKQKSSLDVSHFIPVYSFGMILYELLSGDHPPESGSIQQIPPPKDGIIVNYKLEDLFRKCTHSDPHHRPTAKQLVDILSNW